jgi:hypothetical protein
MTEPDPTLGMIATTFHDLAVAKSRGGYTLIDPYSGTPLARLKPIPNGRPWDCSRALPRSRASSKRQRVSWSSARTSDASFSTIPWRTSTMVQVFKRLE